MLIKRSTLYKNLNFSQIRKILEDISVSGEGYINKDDNKPYAIWGDEIIIDEQDEFHNDVLSRAMWSNIKQKTSDIKYVITKLYEYESTETLKVKNYSNLTQLLEVNMSTLLGDLDSEELVNIPDILRTMIKLGKFNWNRDILDEYFLEFNDEWVYNKLFENVKDITPYLDNPDIKTAYRKWLAEKAIDTSIAFRGSGLPSLAVENIFSHAYNTNAMSLYELMSVIRHVTELPKPSIIGAGQDVYDEREYIDL